MNWSFDTIFFLAFGCLAIWLGLSRSRWLFWGSTANEKLEARLGPGYRRMVNVTFGSIALVFGIYFLLSDR